MVNASATHEQHVTDLKVSNLFLHRTGSVAMPFHSPDPGNMVNLLAKEEPTLQDVLEMQTRMHYDNMEIKNDITELRAEVKLIRESLELYHEVKDEPANYDMSVKDIKKLIAKECKPGQQYYPSDLAFKYGLNYDTVLEAVSSLKEEGRVQS